MKLQHHVQEKEKVLAAEFIEAEQVYKTTEHDLREQLGEKTQIIEVNLEYYMYCTCIDCCSTHVADKSTHVYSFNTLKTFTCECHTKIIAVNDHKMGTL